MRSERRTLAAASFAALLTIAPAGAQPAYVEIADQVGLSHVAGSVLPIDANATLVQRLMQTEMGNGAAVGDYDDDGDLDIYLLSGLGFENRLYRNDLTETGVKGFTDVTTQAGPALADIGLSRVAHFADLDNDGHLDLLLVNDFIDGAPPSRVFRNRGDGTFEDVTAGSGFSPYGYIRGGASLADFNGDGLLDVYVTNWCRLGTSTPIFPGSNNFYTNLGSFNFVESSAAVGLPLLMTDSYTSIFTDFNDDRLPDLHVAIDHNTDEFFLGTAGGFTQATTTVGTTHTGNDMGVACADFDNDGDLDMFSTNITDSTTTRCGVGTTQGNAFYINQLSQSGSLTFTDEAASRGVLDTYWGWGTEFTDADNDGDLDLVAATGFDDFLRLVNSACPLIATPPVFFLNDGTGQFDRTGVPGFDLPDDSRGLVVFDYDRDGDEDILVTNVNQPTRLYENISTNQGNWLTVRLTQRPGLNRFGVGARIDARIGQTLMRRDILAGESYLVGTPAEAHFGLGGATAIDELTVHWTDGTTTTLTDIAPNGMLHVTQPSGAPCDRTGDQQVDIFDLLAYLSDWFAQEPAAEFDGEPGVDIFDLLAFLSCWFG